MDVSSESETESETSSSETESNSVNSTDDGNILSAMLCISSSCVHLAPVDNIALHLCDGIRMNDDYFCEMHISYFFTFIFGLILSNSN